MDRSFDEDDGSRGPANVMRLDSLIIVGVSFAVDQMRRSRELAMDRSDGRGGRVVGKGKGEGSKKMV